MSETELKNYLIKKYIDDGLLDDNLNKISNNWFEPYIHPTDDYIPICSQCNLDFEEFKKNNIIRDIEVSMKHPYSCLWNEYFIKKIKMICPTAKIVKKKK